MRRRIAVLSLAGLVAVLALAPDAHGGCKGRKGGGGMHFGKRGRGKYVTYNGASFGTYAPAPIPPAAPHFPGYAPAAPGAVYPTTPPPMMGM